MLANLNKNFRHHSERNAEFTYLKIFSQTWRHHSDSYST